MLNLPNIETVSAEVHQAWVETKLAQGITSRPAADGTEQMVPYADLPDALKDLDRATVRAVYAAIQRCAVDDKQFHEYHRDTQAPTVHMLHRAEDDKGDQNQRADMAKLIQEIIDLRLAQERERCAVVSWIHYMDICKKRNLPAAMCDEWCAAGAIRRSYPDHLKDNQKWLTQTYKQQ